MAFVVKKVVSYVHADGEGELYGGRAHCQGSGVEKVRVI